MKYIVCLFPMIFSIYVSAQQLPVKNPQPSVAKSISRAEVYWIYTMRTRFWDNGQKITVFYQSFDSSQHKDFVLDVLKQTPSQFETSVSVYVNNGNAAYFRQVQNEFEMRREVESTPGSIGYLSKDYILINRGVGNVETISISN